LDRTDAQVVLEVRGRGAYEVFNQEAGIHRYQRVPPTERRGRVHTSTITVACFLHKKEAVVSIRQKDLRFAFFRGRGPGGQHKNKTDSAVRLTHLPTGIVVIAQYGRKQGRNKEMAFNALRARLFSANSAQNKDKKNVKRKSQVGRGARVNKVRTYCERKDLVVDHRTNKKMSLKKFFKGNIKDLH